MFHDASLHTVFFNSRIDSTHEYYKTTYCQILMKPLSNKALKDLLPKANQYKKFFGNGLYILVRPNGSKYWRLDYRYAGKRNTLSLGVYPEITLENAIEIRDKNLSVLNTGINPKDEFLREKHNQKKRQLQQSVPTKFLIQNDGSLCIRLNNKMVYLTPSETKELCMFLEITKQIILSEV